MVRNLGLISFVGAVLILSVVCMSRPEEKQEIQVPIETPAVHPTAVPIAQVRAGSRLQSAPRAPVVPPTRTSVPTSVDPPDNWYRCQFFDNTNWQAPPAFIKDLKDLSEETANWGHFPPFGMKGFPSDNWSVDCQANIYFEAGSYNVVSLVDEGGFLEIDGVKVQEFGGLDARKYSSEVTFIEGWHSIRVRSYDTTYSSALILNFLYIGGLPSAQPTITPNLIDKEPPPSIKGDAADISVVYRGQTKSFQVNIPARDRIECRIQVKGQRQGSDTSLSNGMTVTILARVGTIAHNSQFACKGSEQVFVNVTASLYAETRCYDALTANIFVTDQPNGVEEFDRTEILALGANIFCVKNPVIVEVATTSFDEVRGILKADIESLVHEPQVVRPFLDCPFATNKTFYLARQAKEIRDGQEIDMNFGKTTIQAKITMEKGRIRECALRLK